MMVGLTMEVTVMVVQVAAVLNMIAIGIPLKVSVTLAAVSLYK